MPRVKDGRATTSLGPSMGGAEAGTSIIIHVSQMKNPEIW